MAAIPDFEKASKQGGDSIAFNGGMVATVDLPTAWSHGRYQFSFPNEMRFVQEMFILVHTNPPGESQETRPKPHEAIYRVKPADGTVNVIPLDWYNHGDFDFGYEWVTQVALDSVTGKIVGNGVRLSPFLMEPDGKLLCWIGPRYR